MDDTNLRDKINWENSIYNNIYKDYLKNGQTNYDHFKLQHAISEVSKGKDESDR